MKWINSFHSLFLYDNNDSHLRGEENNLDAVSFPSELVNTINTNIFHDETDVLESEPHENFPGSDTFLNEQVDFNVNINNVEKVIPQFKSFAENTKKFKIITTIFSLNGKRQYHLKMK